MADREVPVRLQPPGNLFRAPVLADERGDLGPVGGDEAVVAPAVPAIMMGGIAPHLAPDGATVTPQQTGNRCRGEPLPARTPRVTVPQR
jgi:hypothetical protein